MTARGVFFAIDDTTLKSLRGTKGDPKRRRFIRDLEETIEREHKQDTDKAWRILQSICWAGHDFDYAEGLNRADFNLLSTLFYQAKMLHKAERYIINWVPKNELASYIAILDKVTEINLKQRYEDMNNGLGHFQYALSDVQFDYMYAWFLKIRTFIKQTYSQQLHLVFTVAN
ncbi:MAG: DUF1877 family protein [Bacteroidia bacterium]